MSPSATDPVLIIGSGLAGYTLARELRKQDPLVPLHLVSRDDGSFYSKPMLSNSFSAGKQAADLVGKTRDVMQRDLNARIDIHATLQSIDLAAHSIVVDGESHRYRSLVLALGADPVQLPLAGNAAAQVMSVNDLADYGRLAERLQGKRRVVILGAGLIGCEFANDLCLAGHTVNVVDLAATPLARLIPADLGAALRGALEAAGVGFQLQTACLSVDRQTGSDTGCKVSLDNGVTLDADVIISAVGLRPRIAVAREAGLDVARGIVVDRWLRTSDPYVYALGDCAEVCGLVLPYVMPIMQAARALGRTLAGALAAVQYPVMPVVVKTPALPLAIAPPLAGPESIWTIDGGQGAMRATCLDLQGDMHGFALAGTEAPGARRLAAQMAPWLAPIESVHAS